MTMFEHNRIKLKFTGVDPQRHLTQVLCSALKFAKSLRFVRRAILQDVECLSSERTLGKALRACNVYIFISLMTLEREGTGIVSFFG